MFKKTIAPILLCATLAGLSTQASAISFNVNTGINSPVVSTQPISWYCGVETGGGKGFRGTVTGVATLYQSGLRTVHISNVKINKLGGQAGGNKANFESHLVGYGGSAYFDSKYSGDNMKQDGSANNVNMHLGARGAETLRFKFTFDKSGADPSCTSNIALW